MRTIMLSAAYQRSSEPSATIGTDGRYYSHYLARRLPAEVLLDSISQITGVPESFAGHPMGTRTVLIRDTRVSPPFLALFGKPRQRVTPSLERVRAPSLPQALNMINGGTINRRLQSKDGTIGRLVRSEMSDTEIIIHFYLTAFSRRPSPEEQRRILEALEDMYQRDVASLSRMWSGRF
jgi:hypothetical protein